MDRTVYASTYLVALAPLVARRRTDLWAFAIGGLLATVLVTLAFVTVPLVSPPRPFVRRRRSAGCSCGSGRSTPGGRLPLVPRRLGAARRPALGTSFPRCGAGVGLGRGDLAELPLDRDARTRRRAAGRAVPPVRRPGAHLGGRTLRRAARELVARVAGRPVRVLNGGLHRDGSFLGISLAGFLAGSAGPGPVLGVAVGAAGRGSLGAARRGFVRLARPFGYYGGVLGAVAGVLAGLAGGDPWLLVAAFAAAAPLIQAVGRLRCLVNGCCHGRPRPPPSASPTRTEDPPLPAGRSGGPAPPDAASPCSGTSPARRFSCASVHRRAAGLVLGLYLLLNGFGRFAEEAYRGEPQTPVLPGLPLYQWTALASVVCRCAVTVLGSRAAASPPELHAASVGWGLRASRRRVDGGRLPALRPPLRASRLKGAAAGRSVFFLARAAAGSGGGERGRSGRPHGRIGRSPGAHGVGPQDAGRQSQDLPSWADSSIHRQAGRAAGMRFTTLGAYSW